MLRVVGADLSILSSIQSSVIDAVIRSALNAALNAVLQLARAHFPSFIISL